MEEVEVHKTSRITKRGLLNLPGRFVSADDCVSSLAMETFQSHRLNVGYVGVRVSKLDSIENNAAVISKRLKPP